MIIDFSYIPIEIDSAVRSLFEDAMKGLDDPYHEIQMTLYEDDSDEKSGSACSVLFTRGYENNAALTSLVYYTYEKFVAKPIAALIKRQTENVPEYHHLSGEGCQSFCLHWHDNILNDVLKGKLNRDPLARALPIEFFLDQAVELGLEQALKLRFLLQAPRTL